MKAKVLLNAAHSSGGGGLSYLQGVLPYLAADERFSWTLLIPEESRRKLDISDNIDVVTVKKRGFLGIHWWEQMVLPCWIRKQGFVAVLCNANYVPLQMGIAIPLVHTTPRAAGQARGWKMKLYWRILKILTTLGMLRAPLVFCTAKHMIPDYLPESLSRYRRKVRVAYPAVNPAAVIAFVPDNQRESNRIIAIGDFYPQKDYATLIRAMSRVVKEVPEVKLTIIGRFVDAEVTEEVKGLIQVLDLENVVELTGGLPHADLMVRLGQAAVLANTSLAESSNMPVLEAMSVGTPVVCADLPFQHEVAGDGALYVPVSKERDNGSAYASVLVKVLSDKGLRERLREAGDVQAAKFSWEETAQVLADGVWAVASGGGVD